MTTKKNQTKSPIKQSISLPAPSPTDVVLPYDSHQTQLINIHKIYSEDYSSQLKSAAPEWEPQVSLRIGIIPLASHSIRDMTPHSSIRVPMVCTVNSDSDSPIAYSHQEQIIKTQPIYTQPVDVSSIKVPHIITNLFPIFKDVSQITKLPQVKELINHIEKNLKSKLQFPFIVGLSIIHDRYSERIESTLYISFTITGSKFKGMPVLAEDKPLVHQDFITLQSADITPSEFIIASMAHSTNKYPIIYNDRILSVQDSLNLTQELKTINDEAKHVTSKSKRDR